MKHITDILKNLGLEARQLAYFRCSFACLFLVFLIPFLGQAQKIDPQLSDSNNYIFEGNLIVEKKR